MSITKNKKKKMMDGRKKNGLTSTGISAPN